LKLDTPCFVDIHKGPTLFLREWRRGFLGGGDVERVESRKEREKGSCSWDLIYERKRNIKWKIEVNCKMYLPLGQ
jgi:hypothetical protein